jgi:hypothetical protein
MCATMRISPRSRFFCRRLSGGTPRCGNGRWIIAAAQSLWSARKARSSAKESPPGCGMPASLGLSRMFADDLEQLEAGMMLYDAFYRSARDVTREKHEWVSYVAKKVKDNE